MQMILLIGIQATGKTSFYKERFFDTHVRINLDMLKTRRREELLLKACLEAKQPFVIDKMNLSRADRQRYIWLARAAGFSIDGYFFQSSVADALRRNAARSGKQRIPNAGILGANRRLEIPQPEEGFDHLYLVKINEKSGFTVEQW